MLYFIEINRCIFFLFANIVLDKLYYKLILFDITLTLYRKRFFFLLIIDLELLYYKVYEKIVLLLNLYRRVQFDDITLHQIR